MTNMNPMKTYMAKAGEIDRKWLVIDASGRPLGRVATEVARILRGKHKPTFTPHVDTGDHVIILNVDKVALTGNKSEEKIHWHTGYPGGLKSVTRGAMRERQPEKLVMRAVKGMLPHNRLGAAMLKKLRVYRGEAHPHEAQMPEPYTF
jgi:large subunit ribosomal protein L13